MNALAHQLSELSCTYLEKLVLRNFRSYKTLSLELDKRPVIFAGPNGAGKTNILEAVSFFSAGRGLRRATLRSILTHPLPEGAEPIWSLKTSAHTLQGDVDVLTAFDGREEVERRQIKIDSLPSTNQGDLDVLFSLSWLTPQMDGIFLEGASTRRRFLDQMICGFQPSFRRHLLQYETATRERMRLLKAKNFDPHWLSALEQKMAEKIVVIAAIRKDFIEKLQTTCTIGISIFPRANLSLKGVEEEVANMPALELEESLKVRLKEARPQDSASGRTSLGAHLTDLCVEHIEKGIPAGVCSTGEQKALLITIVLANARLQAIHRGDTPIILLDDVVAHLDQDHRHSLYEELLALKSQVWLTGTDVGLFETIKVESQLFWVEQANVTKIA